MSYNFNRSSQRVAQARLARRLKLSTVHLGVWLGVVVALAGVLLIGLHSAASGRLLFGVGLIVYIISTWLYGDILRLESTPPIRGGVLTAMLDPVIAAHLRWPTTPQMLWQDTIQDWQASFVLVRLGIPAELLDAALPTSQEAIDPIFDQALTLAETNGATSLHSGHLVAAMLMLQPELKPVLAKLSLSNEIISHVVAWLERILALQRLEHSVYGGIGRDWAAGFTPTLDHFAANMSREIEQGGHSFGSLAHGEAVEQIIANFSQSAAGVALIGEVGAGKTSTSYAFTQRLIEGDGGVLAYKQVVSLSASLLISAATRPGELEHLFLTILSEAIAAGNIILVLDEAQLFFGSGTGALDLGQLLLPLMQNRRLPLILTLDPVSWQRLKATYPSLAATFTAVTIKPPSAEETLSILADTALGLELKSNTITQYSALVEAYRLSERYITEQAYPGRAIRLLELAYTHAEGKLVTAASVQRAVESSLGVKVVQAKGPESDLLLHLEDHIHARMINQSRAVAVVASALRRARAGVANPKRPVGSFLFLGPTGVGKTELARSLAAVYYSGEKNMTRLDLSEYQQATDLDRLLAADSPFLTAVRQQPFSVILLDELEKAHSNFLNLLLQLLDEGQLTDTAGHSVSFRDAIVIATSNAGAEEIRKRIVAGESLDSFEQAFTDSLVSTGQFRPELLNRFDEIVFFRPLNKEELVQVVGLLMKEVNATLDNQNIRVELTDQAASMLVEKGYDPRLGARPMRRMVQRSVEDAVAEKILRQEATAGDTIRLDVGDLHLPTGKNDATGYDKGITEE